VASSCNDELNIALLRLAEPLGLASCGPGKGPRGWVNLAEANPEPRPASPLSIFQHALGGPLKVALNTEGVVGPHPDGKRILHRTDTMAGASGGPCFDIDWRLVAMQQGHSVQSGTNYALGFAAIRAWLIAVGEWEAASTPPPVHKVVRISDAGLYPARPLELDPELREYLYKVGESERLELKRHAIDRGPDGQPRLVGGKPQLARRLLNSIAAFLNSRAGGMILVGVSDAREIIGIEDEYALVNRQRSNADAYILWLTKKLREALKGTLPLQFVSIGTYREKGRETCAIQIQPSEAPVFIEGALYVRSENENIQYQAHELLAYVSSRWTALGPPGSSAGSQQRRESSDDG